MAGIVIPIKTVPHSLPGILPWKNSTNKNTSIAISNFFTYLRDDQGRQCPVLGRRWRSYNLSCFKGRKKITGFANQKNLRAEAKIAKAESLNVGFMRRLIEQNFELMYSRFALDPNGNLTIVFDTYTLDGSPYKLYYALREVAIKADKQDDLLLDEFKMLQPVDTSHLIDLPVEEKEAKYNYIQSQINGVLDEIEHGKLDKNKYSKGINTLIIDLVYRLDYLIKPEGHMMEALERIHRLNLTNDGKSTILKNQLLIKELQKLVNRPKDEFFKEMYSVTSTFGITSPVSHDRVVGFIDGELHNMDWYHWIMVTKRVGHVDSLVISSVSVYLIMPPQNLTVICLHLLFPNYGIRLL